MAFTTGQRSIYSANNLTMTTVALPPVVTMVIAPVPSTATHVTVTMVTRELTAPPSITVLLILVPLRIRLAVSILIRKIASSVDVQSAGGETSVIKTLTSAGQVTPATVEGV